jgi:hypothetical protein
MKLFGLTDQYFVILMIITGTIVGFWDYKAFKMKHMMDTARKAKIIGRGAIILSVLLFIMSKFIEK